MSVQDASEGPSLPSCLKPEARARPRILPKPTATQSSSPPPGESSNTTDFTTGKVKRIVNKFSKHEEPPTNGTTKIKPIRRSGRPPTIKPKPQSTGAKAPVSSAHAPPLPMKRSRLLQKQKELSGEEEGAGVSVEISRSGKVNLFTWCLPTQFNSLFMTYTPNHRADDGSPCRNVRPFKNRMGKLY